MKLLERYRINPKPEKKRDPRVRRRPKDPSSPDVLYINKSVYGMGADQDSSPEEVVDRISKEYSVRVSEDIDEILKEISKRGWKVSSLDLESDKKHKMRFFRGVGDNKSKTFVKSSPTVKGLFLLALEQILSEEDARYKNRIDRLKRRDGSRETEKSE
tara:strand:- start:134 stop:607 length:474 start_codon:yes stop_codon:yes gene_type:complete